MMRRSGQKTYLNPCLLRSLMDCRVKPGNDAEGLPMAAYWVYVLTNVPRGTLYVGVTNDLVRRAHEHREGLVQGFTARHRIKILVYFERYDTPHAAIQREKNIKHWSRQ